MNGIESTSGNEYIAIKKDGTEFPVMIYSSQVLRNKAPAGLRGIMVDISDRKLAEEQLRKSEKKFRSLVEQAGEMLFLHDLNGKLIDVNFAAVKNTGYSRDELKTMSVFDIDPDARNRDDMLVYWESLKVGDCPVRFEVRHRRKNGSIYPAEVSVSKIVLQDGDYILGLARDISELQKAMEGLRESEEKFSRAFHMSPVPMTITSLDDGRFLDINDAFVFQTGYSRDMAIGSTSTEIGFAEIEDRSRMIDNLNKECRVDNIELSVRRADGSRMTCLYSATPIEIRGKKRLLSAAVDISGEKKIKEELSESRSRFEKMLSVVPDMISIHDLDMNILYSNWQGFASIPRNKRVLNTKCYKTYRGFDHICPDCKARDVIELNSPFQSEEKLPDGRWIDLRVMPINDDDGKLEMFLEWVRDITESKTQQIELQSQKRLIEGVLDSIKDVIGIQLKDHTVLKYNRAGYELLGITEEEVRNKKCYHLIGKSKPCEPCATRIAVKSKKIETIEKYFPALGRHFLCTSNPILDENGEISYIIEQLTDITELRKKEEIFRQSQKMESVGRLAGGVAHDYNNMLSVILGYTEMLLESIDTDDTSYESLIQIQNAAKRSADITRQLLAFARRQTISPKILDINEVVEGMLKMLNRLIGEDIDLAWMPGKSLWPVRLDPSQIDQILANLCVNSRDAISGVGKITIETANISFDPEYCAGHPGAGEGDYILLAVSDNGEGMDPETIQNIFEPFFTTKSEGIGTGLGLATVYGIVKQNDGFINVYSEPEKGSTFKIYLPRDRSETDKKKIEVSSQIPKSRGETVLIVEDEVSILNMGKQMLQRLGYNVLSANKPKDAIELAESHHGKIDLLITDVVMPEMSGRELSEEFSTRYSSVKTLYMSGYTANVIAHHGVLDEGVKFIQKPFSRKDLAVKVRDVLDNGTE